LLADEVHPMLTKKVEETLDALEVIEGQMTVDEVIASFRCIECDAPLTGHRAECAALRCHDCD
jgi:hypothetical protein